MLFCTKVNGILLCEKCRPAFICFSFYLLGIIQGDPFENMILVQKLFSYFQLEHLVKHVLKSAYLKPILKIKLRIFPELKVQRFQGLKTMKHMPVLFQSLM